MASTDAPSLDGCFVKLGRASKHRKELDAALGPALNVIREGVVTETTYDKDARQFRVYLVYAPSIQPEVSAVAGDIIHNLRSALDYAAYQAVWRNRGKRWKRSSFPIMNAPNRFTKEHCVLFRKLGPDFTAIVKRHQPYESENAYLSEGLASDLREAFSVRRANRPLAVLRDLSNWDKHRLLLPRWAAMADASFKPRWARDCEPVLSSFRGGGTLFPGERGAEHSWLATFDANPTTNGRPEMQVDFNFRPTVDLGGTGDDAQELLDVVAAKVLIVLRELQPLF